MHAEWLDTAARPAPTAARLTPMATGLAYWAGAMLLALAVAGCASRTLAPVDSRDPRPAPRAPAPQAKVQPPPVPPLAPGAVAAPVADSGPEFYTVKRGDTLFNIALDHGVSYRELAEWNGLANPNQIRVDQVLRVRPQAMASTAGTVPQAPAGGVEVRPLATVPPLQSRPLESRPLDAAPSPPVAARPPQVAADTVKNEPRALKLKYSEENLALVKPRAQPAPPPVVAVPPPTVAAPAPVPAPAPPKVAAAAPPPTSDADDDDNIDWGWPAAGKVVTGFSESTNKGLDIGGKGGQPVLASASGTVLYVGSGIRGYGKLIVIRHSKAWSTVYAHNSEILVKERQRVVKGQKVAEMGNTDSDQVKLHFEIRKLGKPVDPTKLLPPA